MVTVTIDEDYNATLCLTLGVGPGRANNIDDVTYVQFLLNKIVQDPRYYTLNQMCKPHNKKLVVDGIIGPKTKSQIKAFQLYMKRRVPEIIADGCVDRYGRLDKTRYTFYWLISEIMMVCTCALRDLVDEPDYPPRLSSAARMVQNF